MSILPMLQDPASLTSPGAGIAQMLPGMPWMLLRQRNGAAALNEKSFRSSKA